MLRLHSRAVTLRKLNSLLTGETLQLAGEDELESNKAPRLALRDLLRARGRWAGGLVRLSS
jgi:hypothetical protein